MQFLRNALEALGGHAATVTGTGQKKTEYDTLKEELLGVMDKAFRLPMNKKALAQSLLVKKDDYIFVVQYQLGKLFRMLQLQGKQGDKPKPEELYKGSSKDDMNQIWTHLLKKQKTRGYKVEARQPQGMAMLERLLREFE